MLHTKFRGNRPAGSGEEDFLRVFTIYGRGGHLGHVTSIMSSDATYQVSWKSPCRFWRRRILKGFYHIWAWWPSWSCDPDAANKISFPLPKEAPHKIWR